MLSPVQAYLICTALVLIDLVTRTWRFQWILIGLRTPVSFRASLALNALGDAAAAITPNRLGAEPARLAAAAAEGVPVTAGFVAVVIETLVMWPVLIAAAGWLALIYAPRWWRSAGPELGITARHAWPWIVIFLAAGTVAYLAMRRYFPSASASMRRGSRRAFAYARRMPAWPLIACVPLTLIGQAARVAILPVLALTLPNPPPMGPLFFGSFALLYAQLLLPTPSGAGVVDIGFVGGAVGHLGERHKQLLFVWRVFTTILPVAIGVVLGLKEYGKPTLAALTRGRMQRRAVAMQEAADRDLSP